MPLIDFEIDGKTILNREPIGGWFWLRQHQGDHTHAEMESLSIQLGFDGKMLPPLRADTKKGTIKTIVKGG
ncbi:hypothetical protein ES708_22236 [subsurface metagenome]